MLDAAVKAQSQADGMIPVKAFTAGAPLRPVGCLRRGFGASTVTGVRSCDLGVLSGGALALCPPWLLIRDRRVGKDRLIFVHEPWETKRLSILLLLYSSDVAMGKQVGNAPEAARPARGPWWRSKKFIIAAAVAAALIIIALAVGLGVGLTRGKGGQDDQGEEPRPPGSGVNRTTLYKPKAGTPWQIILSKPVKLADDGAVTPRTEVYDLDMFDNDADSFVRLYNAGIKVICYFSAGTYEEWRSDKDRFDQADMGKPLDDWPGERWLNVSSPSVRDIMKERIKLAASKGCLAIDPDNVDGYQNDNGIGLTSEQAVDFVKFLSDEAAAYNMSTGLKNAADIIHDVIDVVAFSVNEQCVENSECESYSPFIEAGKPVFNIEYPKDAGSTRGVSATMSTDICSRRGKSKGANKFSTVIKKKNLDGWVEYCDKKVFTTDIFS
ncbi:endo alpha-1,4 polygalactosaminidase precursor [Metarhizium album ARSEF 1941]|uniref:alpha-galactosidase n=1 Tax=Metarhizium album (strain ARSEF 1941) TaxID=1081103 RepID=A0A0B2WLD3_METAS|nr:endo alpha-1,4 polygalactosaminidase precursor [Metarhizium album ARSEF 1941]KHN93825.1 endo alpha-1,4 polygalactosaminidase precursor [Metarhizium album ARSEF 1941]